MKLLFLNMKILMIDIFDLLLGMYYPIKHTILHKDTSCDCKFYSCSKIIHYLRNDIYDIGNTISFHKSWFMSKAKHRLYSAKNKFRMKIKYTINPFMRITNYKMTKVSFIQYIYWKIRIKAIKFRLFNGRSGHRHIGIKA